MQNPTIDFRNHAWTDEEVREHFERFRTETTQDGIECDADCVLVYRRVEDSRHIAFALIVGSTLSTGALLNRYAYARETCPCPLFVGDVARGLLDESQKLEEAECGHFILQGEGEGTLAEGWRSFRVIPPGRLLSMQEIFTRFGYHTNGQVPIMKQAACLN